MSDSATAHIGVTGLAVMGRNLARNFARHGYTVAVHNRTTRARRTRWSRSSATRATSSPAETLGGVRRLAGAAAPRSSSWSRRATPTDAVIDELAPLLEPGDIIIDGGNAHFADTRRREKRAARARPPLRRHRHLRRRGGRAPRPVHHAGRLEGVLRARSARCSRRSPPRSTATPCCAHIGPDGAGHFVKMVHNGIEYADMQLIAEAYDLLARGAGSRARRDRRGLPRVERRASSTRT